MNRARFVVVSSLVGGFAYFGLHALFGLIVHQAPIGWLVENWVHALAFAQFWAVLALVQLFRPNAWIGVVVALVVWGSEFSYFAVIRPAQFGEDFNIAAQWYGVRPLIYGAILATPAYLIGKMGKATGWSLESLAVIGEKWPLRRLKA